MLTSWKTTLCGVMGIVVATWQLVASPLLDGNPSTSPDWTAFSVALSAGLGLFLARDNDKKSETVGAK